MKGFLKWTGIILAALVGVIVLALAVIYFKTEARLKHVYTRPNEIVSIPTDAASLAYGKRIFQFRGCEACHGEHLEGKVYLSDPALGEVNASNLTTGLGGVGRDYSDADWVAAIRHGLRPDGTPLLFMPSTEFYFLSGRDLGAVIAYVKSAPPADHVQARSSLSLTGRVAMALVPALTFIPAELIPLDAPRPVAPAPGITPAYGEYLTYSCKVCHGLSMSGGPIPAFPGDWPPALNLTWGEGSSLPAWSEDEFIHFMRTGTAHGKMVDSKYMPWTSYQHMTDDELRAVWVYLQSLPPKDYGNR